MIAGNPSPSLVWEREENKPLNSSKDGALVISAATGDNQGKYICRATNNVGTSEATAFLTVQGITQIMLFIPILHFRNVKRPGAEMGPEIDSGIVTGKRQSVIGHFCLSLATVPDVFEKVYSPQFPSKVANEGATVEVMKGAISVLANEFD